MELIREAGLNTLLGMGMTFLVLISLSLIIALFGKILNGGFQKKDQAPAPMPLPNAPEKSNAQASLAKEEDDGTSSGQDQAPSDPGEDAELMAVIAAAVAAYEECEVSPETAAVISAAIAAYEAEEGAAPVPGVSGFAVRKIRKSRRHVA